MKIQKVESQKQLKDFVNLPWKIYKNDPLWVPPLKLTVHQLLSPKHPFHQTAQVTLWLLINEKNEIIGRIATILNNFFSEKKIGHFGMFECIEDQNASQFLLDHACQVLKSAGMTIIEGPYNLSTNYECGLLLKQSVPDSPQIMMTYNPAYYQDFLESYGFTKAMDLLAYDIPIDTEIPKRIVDQKERVEKSHRISYRCARMDHWEEEVAIMKDIYNSAWEENWGFVPMTDAEFNQMAKELKPICNPRYLWFIEVEGKSVGFMVALGDYNQVFKEIPNGKLFPFGIFKILNAKKYITRTRIVTLGIKKEYRNLGLSHFLICQIQKEFMANPKLKKCEMSWILENNRPMNRPLQLLGANAYKTYRIFQKEL